MKKLIFIIVLMSGICYSQDSSTVGIAWQNRMMEEELGYRNIDSVFCDSLKYSGTLQSMIAAPGAGKRIVISFISIQTDSTDIGYALANNSTVIMSGNSLSSNIQAPMNLVNSPITLWVNQPLTGRCFLTGNSPNVNGKRITWITIKYKII